MAAEGHGNVPWVFCDTAGGPLRRSHFHDRTFKPLLKEAGLPPIKRTEDFAAVRAVCQGRLGELPAIYAIADICRPSLLVEIEGIAFSSNA
jgi:hypothetical protein